jgi:serine/threonine-protein kinase
MTEYTARRTLESVGLKIASVEKVNNKDVPEGDVVNTRPAIGAMVKEGEAIKLLISMKEEPKPKPAVETPSIPGRSQVEPILIDTSISELDQPKRSRDTSVLPERIDSQRTSDPHSPEFNIPTNVGTTTTPPGVPVAAASPDAGTSTGAKVARIRYQVPPILRPLPLKIEIVDARGKRVLLERNARTSEVVQIDGSYSQEAVVTIWLGGESVWQERYR